jgi:hypothetical protein
MVSTLHLIKPLENQFNQETHITNSDTPEAHVIHAYHLYYLSLLDDLAKHIAFVRDTKNPMLDTFESHDREFSEKMMIRECQNMLMEVQRLKDALQMQDRRLKNLLKYVNLFSYHSQRAYSSFITVVQH